MNAAGSPHAASIAAAKPSMTGSCFGTSNRFFHSPSTTLHDRDTGVSTAQDLSESELTDGVVEGERISAVDRYARPLPSRGRLPKHWK
jgi:hypothetical protein